MHQATDVSIQIIHAITAHTVDWSHLFSKIFFKKYGCNLSTRHTCKIGMESNGDIDTIASSSCMTENEDEDEHIITGISDDEVNDSYYMATDDNTIFDK